MPCDDYMLQGLPSLYYQVIDYRMKILFLLSTNVWFDHLSGEQEAKALQLGFSLLGVQCDFASIDAEDFSEYDMYVIFSMCPDVQEKIKFIDAHKRIIVVPQTEEYTDATLCQLAKSSCGMEYFYIVARNDMESKFFSHVCLKKNIIYAAGWFVEPFVWNEEINSQPFSCYPDQDYVLSFVGDSLDEQSVSFFKRVAPPFKRVVISSQRCLDAYFSNASNDGIEHRKLIKYGTEEWFSLLLNAKYYYEPNRWLTSAVLESFWLGGEVVSPHCEQINSLLNMPLLVSEEGAVSGIPKSKKREHVSQFRVEHVANGILNKINGGN